MKDRQQNSANYPLTFLLVSATDHVSPVTGATPAVTLSKNGAAFGSPAGAVTEVGNGWYQLAGNAADRNTIGPLLLHATATGADPADDRYDIVPWDPYDGAGLGLTRLDAAVSTRSTYAGADTAGTTTLLSRLTAQRATNLDNLDATVSGVPSSVWASGTRTLTAFAFSVTVGTNNDKSGYSLATPPPTAGQISTAVVDQTLAGHTAAGTVGGALTAASSAGDPWGAALPGGYGPGTAGNLIGTRIDAAVSSVPGSVWGVATRTLTSFGTLASDVWGATTRSLTDKANYGLTPAYDAAKTAGDATSAKQDAILAKVPDLASIIAGVWGAASRTLTGFGSLVSDIWNSGARSLTDKSNFTLTSDYDAAKAAASSDQIIALADQIDDLPEARDVADAVLGRNLAGGSDGGRTVQDALRFSRNRVVISSNTITVYAEDDETIAWQGTLTTDATAAPITGVDPA